MMRRRSALFVAGTLLLLAGICWGLENLVDDRKSTLIRVLPPPRGTEAADSFTSSVVRALQRDGFNTAVESSGTLTPREILAQDPNIHHLIADFAAGDHGSWKASVYNQGAESPRALKAFSTESLAAQVVQYLESEPMVRWRLDRHAIKDEFDAEMTAGLKYILQENDLEQAIAAFLKAADLKPRNAWPQFHLSVCYYRRADYAKCNEAVDKGLALDPENYALKNQKAVLLMREGHFEEATQILEGLQDDHAVIQWNLAYSYFQQGKPSKAKERLMRVLALDPGSDVRTIAQDRLDELEDKENSLRVMKRTLWLAGGGLLCICMSTPILLLLRRANRQIRATPVGPADTIGALGLKIQVALASVTLLSGFLNQVLGQLLGK